MCPPFGWSYDYTARRVRSTTYPALVRPCACARRPMGHNPTQSSPGRVGDTMFGIPRRYSHFVFGTIQAGLTSLIAAGIARTPFTHQGHFLSHWLLAWLISWAPMLPIVLFAAPASRTLSFLLTEEEPTH